MSDQGQESSPRPPDSCSQCGGGLPSIAHFCPHCGQTVNAAAVPRREAVEPPPAPAAPATASPQEWLCRCGASNPTNLIACRRCGANPAAADDLEEEQPGYASPLHRLLQVSVPGANPPPEVPAATPPVPGELACPSCGNAAVQKVSAIVHAGTWSGRSSGLSVGVGHISGGPNLGMAGANATQSAGSTALAQLLAPPDKPDTDQSPERTRILVLGLIAFACVFGALVCLSNSNASGGITWLLLAALLGYCRQLWVRRTSPGSPEYERAQEQARQWSRRRARWDRLFYCSRCDSVFDPEDRSAVPVRRIHSLLGS